MKKNVYSLIILISLIAGITSCRKKSADITPVKTADKAFVQWYNATVNSSRNYIYVNGNPANGTAVAYGASFPASSYAFMLYPGSNGITIKDTLTTTTQAAQNFVQSFQAGKNYTIFTYDTITAPKRIVVENAFDVPVDNTARIRFANLIYNPTAIPNVDISSFRRGPMFDNIPVATVTGFITMDAGVTDTLYVKQTGTSTLLFKTAMNLIQGRSYSAIYRGSYRTTTKTVSIVGNN